MRQQDLRDCLGLALEPLPAALAPQRHLASVEIPQAAKFEGLTQGAHGAQATRVPASGRGTRLLGLGLAGIAAKRAGVMRQVALKTRSGGQGRAREFAL